MAMLFWYGEGDDDAVSAGSLLRVAPALSEVSTVLEGRTGFEELESMPAFAEQKVTRWWLSQVSDQAQRFLREYSNEVSGQTRTVLERLISEIRKSAVTPPSAKRH